MPAKKMSDGPQLCRYCGRELPVNAVFCAWCGRKQLEDKTEIKVPPPRQLPSGTWFGRVTVRGQRVPVSAETEADYYVKARAAKAGLIEAKKQTPKLTLGAAIDNYIEANDKVLSPSTINAYRSYRKTRFQAYVGRDIGSIPYQAMVNEESQGVSPKTVHNAWRLVTASLRYAGAAQPVVNLPKKPRAERKWLDYQQIETFAAALRGKPYEIGALLALHGLRRSELLHLTAEDIDVEREVIHVRGASVIGDGNKLVEKKTNKNRSSARDVHILVPRLTELVTGRTGRLVTTNPTTLYGAINGLCRKHGLPETGVHGLRHSYISLCFHLGWNIQTVMREGGYSTTDTVNDVYRHLAAQDANEDIQRGKDFFKMAMKMPTAEKVQ